ncbi:hypothetical protein J2067_004597 [Erwinia rhapontici]|nr:hypothetical protein [Erwinia rhapontici]
MLPILIARRKGVSFNRKPLLLLMLQSHLQLGI